MVVITLKEIIVVKKLLFFILPISLLTVSVPLFAAETQNLRFGMQASITSIEYRAAKHAAMTLKQLSGGSLTISLYPDAQLGDDSEMLEQVSMGDLDITHTQLGRIGDWIPRAKVTELPYTIRDFEHIKSIYNSAWGKQLRQEMIDKYRWHPIAISYFGTRQTTSNRKINSIADFKGLKLRVPNAKPMLDFAKYAGAFPLPIAFSEVYLALQTKAVDGQENPLPTVKAKKFYEVQKYIAMTNHMVQDIVTVVSEATYQKLSDEDRKLLEQSLQVGANHMANAVFDGEADLIEFFQQQGVIVTTPDLTPFKAAMKPIYDQFEKRNGKGLIAEISTM